MPNSSEPTAPAASAGGWPVRPGTERDPSSTGRWKPETEPGTPPELERHARRLEAFADMQHELLGLVLACNPLPDTLEWIARRMEAVAEGSLLCSIFIADEDAAHLRLIAAPGLPEEYNQAIQVLPVREGIGSCGTAAARGETVIVEDTLTHPDWFSVRELVRRYQLRACWSMPVHSSRGRILGTMAIYHSEPRGPTPQERHWAEAACRLTGLAIERSREAKQRLETDAWLGTMLESLDDAFFTLDREWRFVTLNRQTEILLQRPRAELIGRIIWEEFREAGGTAFEAKCRGALKENQVMVFEEFQPGPQRWLEVRIHPAALGLAIYFRDVTAARHAAEALRESEERFKSVAKATADTLWDLDLAHRTLWWNGGMQKRFGYSPQETGPGLDWWLERVHADERDRVRHSLQSASSGEKDSWVEEYRFRHRDGSYIPVLDRGFVIRDATGKPIRMTGGMTDLTDHYRSEKEAREAAAMQARIAAIQKETAGVELNLQAVINLVAARAWDLVSADGAVVALIEEDTLVYCATAGAAVAHRDLRVPLGESLSGQCVKEGQVLWSDDTASDPRVNAEHCRRLGARSLMVAPLRSGDMNVGVLLLYSHRPSAFTGRDTGALAILAESLGAVIWNHLTASRLKASETQYRLLFDHHPHPMWAYDTATLKFLTVNAAALDHYGYSRAEFLAMTVPDLHPPEDLPLLSAHADGHHPLDQSLGLWRHRRKDGTLIDVEISSDAVVLNEREARLVLAHDVTERRRSDRELARLNRAQRMLSSCNDAFFNEDDEVSLLHKICGIAVEIGNYRMAWIGYAREDAARSIEPMAFAGAEDGYLSHIRLNWRADSPAGQGPAGTTIRTGQPFVCEDIMRDEITLAWREEARERGYRGVVCLPLKDGERTFGILVLWSARPRRVAPEEIRLFQNLADDTALGILNLRSRAEHSRIQAAVLKMAASVSAGTGTEFFENLVHNMADALGAMGAVVAKLIPGTPPRVRTIAAVMDGRAVPGFEYPQPGSPCGGLNPEDDCVIPAGVGALYPAVPALAAAGAEAYVGRLLRNAAGDAVGILYLLFDHPLTDPQFVSSTLKIFAARAASELQRQHDDARIRQQASLLDKAQDAILVRDFDQRIIFWNKGAERLYGWKAEEVYGLNLEEVLHADPARLEQARQAVLKTGEWTGQLEKTTRGGTPMVLDSRWTLLHDADGLPNSILTIDTDITEKRKLEQQFLRAQRMESIGTLAGGIAHDLNNVLAPIIMSIDLLKLTVSGADNHGILDTIAESAKRGAAMVGQVLSFARGMEGRKVPVNARQLLAEVEKIARDTFPKNIRIQSMLPLHLWTLEGDHTQLHQVLLNLCVNARDAMPEGGALTLSAANLDLDDQYAAMNPEAKPGPYLVIKAEDNGSGIPAGVLEKIFDPFFTTKEPGKGTGLGLSTSMAIIKGHDGFLRVYSEPGKGTAFRVYLPALPDMQDPGEAGAEEAVSRGNGELVLVIDDEPSIGTITRQTLESFGYRVMVATDGAEGITLYARFREEIAVVLTDMMMPVMDGPSTIQVLMRMNKAVRIIAASGISSNNTAARAAGTAVRDFLPKPYTAHTLLRTLRRVLDEPD